MEKITATAPTAPTTAPTSRTRRVRGPARLGGVSIVRQGAGEPSPVRRVWVCVLLPVFVGARSRARGVSRDRVSMRGRWRRATFRR